MKNDPGLRTLFGCAAMILTVAVFLSLAKTLVATLDDLSNGSEPSTDAVETPPPPAEAPAAPADPVDWSWVPPTVAIAAAVVVVALVMWFVLHRRARSRAARRVAGEVRAAQLERWRKGASAYAETAAAITAFETDPETIFIRPLLLDTSEIATAAAFTAFHEADKLHLENVPHDEALITAFVDAATAAKEAFHQADANARSKAKAGITHNDRQLTATERRNLERAQHLLAVALDPSTQAAHARNAIEKALELVDGLVEIPDRYQNMLKAGIEARHQFALNS